MTHRRILAAGLILGSLAAPLAAAPTWAADLHTGGIALSPAAMAGTSAADRQGGRAVSVETLFFGMAARDRASDQGGAAGDPTDRALGMTRPALTADIFGLTQAPRTAGAADPRR
ncbi:hypothetical protein C882_3373 [Caenispirillum salinarum AK4]|uniref:Uncharacterized protein n=1 Tax=Caenispirillum salinarum AK4 TaxID=1238182 RepID=K9H5N8_9PROT|nr:hypothetical protein [Caenispirillum salinarum]EKV25958.1 hypothetical protein C882_3373 [Caenispirillum salinarum AK4]